MTHEQLIERIKFLCESHAKYVMTKEEENDIRCGDMGQYDDTYDAGVTQGEGIMAQEILELIKSKTK